MISFKQLLSPLQIGPMEVRNRVLISAHVPGLAKDNKPSVISHAIFFYARVPLPDNTRSPVHRSPWNHPAIDNNSRQTSAGFRLFSVCKYEQRILYPPVMTLIQVYDFRQRTSRWNG